MKPVDSGKNALAAVAALMPCSACNTGVLQSGASTVDVKKLTIAIIPCYVAAPHECLRDFVVVFSIKC